MSAPLQILLIEDDDSDAKLIESHLHGAGYTTNIERIETAAQMGAALAAHRWDLVLSDFSLPRFSSLEALEALHASSQDLPFIILSGAVQEEQAVATLKAGAHDFILKDRLARLVPAIERELREAGDRQQRRQAVTALLTSEARFKALIEHSSDAIMNGRPELACPYYCHCDIESHKFSICRII